MKLLTIYAHDVYNFPLSAVRNGKFHTAQEPIKLLDFMFRTARENSHIMSEIKVYKVTWSYLIKCHHCLQKHNCPIAKGMIHTLVRPNN